MALMQITMIPLGRGVGVGEYIAEIQRKLMVENVTFKLTDMATLIEGEAKDLFTIVEAIYEIPFDNGAVRVVTNISIDDRRDKQVHIGDKTRSVEKRLLK